MPAPTRLALRDRLTPQEWRRLGAMFGVIALDNTLVVTRHFGGLPDEVVVIEVEPGVQEFGEDFSEPVAKVIDQVCALAVAMATDAGAVARLPSTGLGGALPSVAGNRLG